MTDSPAPPLLEVSVEERLSAAPGVAQDLGATEEMDLEAERRVVEAEGLIRHE